MKKTKIFLLFIATVFLAVSCFEEESEIIHQSTPAGAVAEVTPITSVLIVSDLENSALEFTATVDTDYVSATVNVTYKTTGVTGVAATYTQIPETITITATELVNALEGVSFEDLAVPDEFVVTVSVTSPNGVVTSSAESSFSAFVACPSSLQAGTYNAVSNGTSTDTDPATNPAAENIESVVTITQLGPITFLLENSYGGVMEHFYCGSYGYCGISDDNMINDFCGELSGDWGDAFGSVVWAEGSYDEATGVITIYWENEYGDNATMVLTPQ